MTETRFRTWYTLDDFTRGWKWRMYQCDGTIKEGSTKVAESTKFYKTKDECRKAIVEFEDTLFKSKGFEVEYGDKNNLSNWD